MYNKNCSYGMERCWKEDKILGIDIHCQKYSTEKNFPKELIRLQNVNCFSGATVFEMMF